jgi:hypothetical protein
MAGVILRIRVDGNVWDFDKVADQWRVIGKRLMGPFAAGQWGIAGGGYPARK